MAVVWWLKNGNLTDERPGKYSEMRVREGRKSARMAGGSQ